MTEVRFIRDNSGCIVSFSAVGHSGFASSGNDIVCAAISAILQAAVFTLKMLYAPTPEYHIAPGSLSCNLNNFASCPPEKQAEVQAILRHTLLALMNIALSEPRHVSLCISDIADWQTAFKAQDVQHALQEMLGIQG